MDDRQEETINPIIIDGFTNTLLPVFSWFLSRLLSGILGCKLTVVLLHPTTKYRDRVAGTWVENNWLFSCSEILSFETASGRRRGRKKLRKLLRPFFREMKRSREWLLFRHRFQEKWNRLKGTSSDDRPPTIPPKARIEIDIAKLEKRRDEQVTAYSQDDILSAFPIGSTFTESSLRRRVKSEVDDYPETMRSLLWEASQYWNLIGKIEIREDSKFWEILGFDPNDAPNLEALIDWILDFSLGEANEDKLMYLTRWFMDRIVVSQFILHPYSDKRFVSLHKRVADGLTLEDTVADYRVQDVFDEIDNRELLESALEELSPAQREAAELNLQAEDTSELRRRLGDKKSSSVERNFQRALKRLEELRKSGKLLT